MARRAKLPLNPSAVKAANEAVGDRTLDPSDPADAAARRDWMDAYIEAGGEIDNPSPQAPPLKSPHVPCTENDVESCFQCRQRLADEGKKSDDPAIQQAAEDMDRLNHDLEHAKLAEHVYEDANSTPPEGWRALDPSDPADRQKLDAMGIEPSALEKNGSDFRARVYEPDPAVFGDNMKTTIAFKGTTTGEDWMNNFEQGIGAESDYYRNAVNIGKRTRMSGADVEFTGHSLGGGMASAASRASGKDATTFNSAGLHDKTVAKYKAVPQDSNINAYRVENEALTGLQEPGWKMKTAATVAGFALGGVFGALIGKFGVSSLAPEAVGDKYDVKGKGNPVTRHGMGVAKDGVAEQIMAKEEILENELGIDCDC